MHMLHLCSTSFSSHICSQIWESHHQYHLYHHFVIYSTLPCTFLVPAGSIDCLDLSRCMMLILPLVLLDRATTPECQSSSFKHLPTSLAVRLHHGLKYRRQLLLQLQTRMLVGLIHIRHSCDCIHCKDPSCDRVLCKGAASVHTDSLTGVVIMLALWLFQIVKEM